MSQLQTDRAKGRPRNLFLAWGAACLCLFTGQVWAALTLSPTSVTVPALSYATVKISGARGQIQAESQNTAVAKVSLSGVTRTGATLNVYGAGAGSTTIYVRDARTSNLSLPVTVTPAMTVSPTSLSVSVGATGTITASGYSGAVSASSANTGIATVSVSNNVVAVKGVTAGSTVVAVKDSKVTVNVPVTVVGSPSSAAKYSLIAWNDLGMHCMDGNDYSVFSILPPFNNLHAQLVNASTGKAVTSGVTLWYEAVSDPTGSLNTWSAGPGKTNFWDWAKTVYNATLSPNVGLTGNATPSLTAKPMTLDADNLWFEASGIPITPYADNVVSGKYAKNYYPTVKVTAKDATGTVLATTTTVLPVSDEITCAACHASRGSGTTAQMAAMPSGGWVDSGDPERDWKLNIVKLHDQKQSTSGTSTSGPYNSTYQTALNTIGRPTGLYDSAATKSLPTLCAACHGSNALPGYGLASVSKLTSAQHKSHGAVTDPNTNLKLDDSTNRGACYLCHPGSLTACLRGAMSTTSAVQCQSCHSSMSKVGDPARVGWLEQPNCQACHYNGTRTTSAVDASGNLVKPADTRFATNPDTPALVAFPTKQFSLYRFSTGHGGMQCESCHGATHAEYPSTHDNDNLQSIALQGYAGTIRECTVCHATPPLSRNGGPHGMHTVGAAWVSNHGNIVEASGGAAECAYCHGSDYKGSPLAQVKAPRSFTIEGGGTRSYAAGQNVGCYDCHNGPHP